MKKFLDVILFIPRYIAKGLVLFYQKCISPLLPHACRFTLSCSTYAMECIGEYGFFKGIWLATKRVFRCNPFSKGGVDPVKPNLKGDFKWLM